MDKNQHILKSSHANYEMFRYTLLKEISNKLEVVFRGQENIKCNTERQAFGAATATWDA